MRNMPQATRGQLVHTPHGEGFISQFWPMQIGDELELVAYFVFLLTPQPPEYGYPYYSARELAPLNPGTFFPYHKGEILQKMNRSEPKRGY